MCCCRRVVAQAHFEEVLRLDPERVDAEVHKRYCESQMPPPVAAPVTAFYVERVFKGLQEAKDPPGPEGSEG